MSEETSVLHIKMFGKRFCAYIGEEENVHEIFSSPMLRNRSIKMLHFFAYLLYFHGKNIETSELLKILYGEDYGETAPNNLRAIVFRLRKILSQIGLPGKGYILNQKGIYRWDDTVVQLDIDVEVFNQRARHALSVSDGENQIEELKQLVLGFQGDFLKLFENETWVFQESLAFRGLLGKIMERLCGLLNESDRQEEIVEVSSWLIHSIPDEKWYIYQIQAYLAMKMPDMAYRSYEHAIKTLVNQYGQRPSRKLQDIFKGMNKRIEKSLETINEIRDMLSDDRKGAGAYYYSLPSFIDCYRFLGRIALRHKNSAFLILCTITDADGNAIVNEKKLDLVSIKLGEAILISLRNSDLLTRYNMSQYLILLSGIVREDCSIVTSRISRNFKKLHGSPNYFINYYITSVLDSPSLCNVIENK